ncbi:Ent-copalyl diphosphate synthase [Forsythia ovata]|uniref:Ent-copalyl diphosphate synthase n=1 Tax=Forsythia ovata TaxID=205694 RepID=A0ABD1W778_9LAMI
MASIFEPERSRERFAWVKSHMISKMISSYFNKEDTSSEKRVELLAEFTNNINSMGINGYHNIRHRLITILMETLHQISIDALEWIGRDVSHQLHDAMQWGKWFMNLNKGLFKCQEIELIVSTLNICAGHIASEETQSQLEYKNLCKLVNKIYEQLHDHEYQNKKVQEIDHYDIKRGKIEYMEIEQDMQSLLQLVLQKSDGINMDLKQTFLMVAKAFYYRAYFTMETIDFHISKVLFEQVV